MLNTPWRPNVAVNPLFRPFNPNPSWRTISRAVAKVLGLFYSKTMTEKCVECFISINVMHELKHKTSKNNVLSRVTVLLKCCYHRHLIMWKFNSIVNSNSDVKSLTVPVSGPAKLDNIAIFKTLVFCVFFLSFLAGGINNNNNNNNN